MTDAAPRPHRHAQQAGILCNDPRFQRFTAERLGIRHALTVTAAAEYLRRFCQIDSRRALDADPEALHRFQTLHTEFDAWTGKIARPRE